MVNGLQVPLTYVASINQLKAPFAKLFWVKKAPFKAVQVKQITLVGSLVLQISLRGQFSIIPFESMDACSCVYAFAKTSS